MLTLTKDIRQLSVTEPHCKDPHCPLIISSLRQYIEMIWVSCLSILLSLLILWSVLKNKVVQLQANDFAITLTFINCYSSINSSSFFTIFPTSFCFFNVLWANIHVQVSQISLVASLSSKYLCLWYNLLKAHLVFPNPRSGMATFLSHSGPFEKGIVFRNKGTRYTHIFFEKGENHLKAGRDGFVLLCIVNSQTFPITFNIAKLCSSPLTLYPVLLFLHHEP